jgi:phospholipase C
MSSTQYATGALFINYDEWGGFFDHVSPMYVPDDRSPRYLGQPDDLDNEFGITGFRVPCVAVSPYAKGGGVSHSPLTHESILSLISYRFGLGYLNTRHRFASNIGATLDFKKTDKRPPTGLPSPSAPIPFGTGPGTALPCAVPATPTLPAPLSRSASRSEGVELNSPAMIDYVERVGFKFKPAKPSDIFSKPDSTVKSLLGKH